MEKLDLKKTRKEFFTAPLNRFVPINVPAVSYLMVDGHGDPNTAPAYKLAVESLYATAYTIKFSCKAKGKTSSWRHWRDFGRLPTPKASPPGGKDEWNWTMIMMVPDYVDDEAFLAAGIKVRQKLGTLPEGLRLESLEEGLCLQALDVGSYDDEGPLLAALHGEVMPSGGYDFAGRHHEVYLSDPRKAPPETLKTVIRQPVRQN